jgi:hypothetical protein
MGGGGAKTPADTLRFAYAGGREIEAECALSPTAQGDN